MGIQGFKLVKDSVFVGKCRHHESRQDEPTIVNLTGFAGTFMERHQLGGIMFGGGSGKEEECRQVASNPKILFPTSGSGSIN